MCLTSLLVTISFMMWAPIASAALPNDLASDTKTGLTILKKPAKKLPKPIYLAYRDYPHTEDRYNRRDDLRLDWHSKLLQGPFLYANTSVWVRNVYSNQAWCLFLCNHCAIPCAAVDAHLVSDLCQVQEWRVDTRTSSCVFFSKSSKLVIALLPILYNSSFICFPSRTGYHREILGRGVLKTLSTTKYRETIR